MTAVTISTTDTIYTDTVSASSVESPDLSPESGSLRAGEVLGRYELLFPIASGGMATVHAARLVGEGEFQRAVALKVILPHLANDPRFVSMFMDEARLAARIRSPHVVAALELGRHADKTLFMAMELVIGVSLRQLFDDAVAAGKTIPIPVLGSILVQAAKGLADAHGARAVDGSPLGLVHRDVSPHNILVGIDGHARIADFGIAHAVTRATATQTGELKGKLPYFSPEQVRCDEPDARSDVFSLGIVAWEMFAGQRLFDAPNPLATAQAVAAKPVPPLDAVRGDVPKVIAQVVRDALERDLDRRLESAERFANRLEDACKRSTGLANAREVEQTLRELCGDSVARLERSLNLALATPTGAHRPLPLPLRTRSKRPQLVIAAAASLLLFAALAFALSVSPGRSSVGAPPELSRAAPANADLPSQLPQRAANDAPTGRSADDAGVRGLDNTPAHGSTDTASTSPPKSDSRRRAAPRRAKNARAAARPDAPAQPAGGWLLRDISEFDRERTR